MKFEPSGKTWKRPNWTNFGFANGGLRYPSDQQSAHAGEELPIPKLPPDAPLQGTRENPYAGCADYYQLRYGPYLIAMNRTKEKTFELDRPADVKQAIEVGTGNRVSLESPVRVAPRSTLVFFVGPVDGKTK